jgi:hypothetical protein
MTEANRPKIPLIVEEEEPPKTPKKRVSRQKRVLSRMVEGASLDEIGSHEKITRGQTEHILRSVLRKRWVAPAQEFARLQIARLDAMMANLIERMQKGELAAIDRALKIIDRLDRYHGFSRAPFHAVEPYGEEERTKLLNKLNEAAARLTGANGEESPEE